MKLPVRLTSNLAWALVPLLLVPALYAAEAPAAPEATPNAVDATTPDFDLFPADPLAEALAGGVRVSPATARRGAGASDWAQLIDDTWGPSPWTISEMLLLYDTFWFSIDRSFACFQGLDVDWAAMRDSDRGEIASGVSRGRFVAIMNHLALALRESHTTVRNSGLVNEGIGPGVPLFAVGGWGNNSFFGAGLTPLPDGSLLVYQTVPNHPLGLVPGDIVLGYEGVPWRDLYPELLAAELPLTGFWWGSSPSSFRHSMLMSAGLNWHLFDTIDVVKYATGETVHLPVAPLASGGLGTLDCTEQLPVPGVPKPNYLGSGDTVSWGIVEGTQVGYVYARAWINDAGVQFRDAVRDLLTQHDTRGLIFDFRTNYGGNMGLAYPALSLLFGHDTLTVGFASRCSAVDHLAMCPAAAGLPSHYHIDGIAAADYDRPIAVLVGPGAISAGDQVANLFRFHPQARFFGKSTTTAFNGPAPIALGFSGWSARYAQADAYLVTDPTNYLTHDEFPVDEPVWFTPDDVAQGKDTVVEAALRWVLNEFPVCHAARATIEGPLDRALAPVTIEGVTDPNGDPLTIVATAITQDEPVMERGRRATCPDAAIIDGVAHLRRERSVRGNGRVYVVSFTANDGRGGDCQGTARLCVPRIRGINGAGCVDDGQDYDSLGACGQ